MFKLRCAALRYRFAIAIVVVVLVVAFVAGGPVALCTKPRPARPTKANKCWPYYVYVSVSVSGSLIESGSVYALWFSPVNSILKLLPCS